MKKFKEIMCECFEEWEMWTYFCILPLGMILSATFGYIIGKIFY